MNNTSLIDQIDHLIKIVKSTLQLSTYQKHELTKLLTMTSDMIQENKQYHDKYSTLVDSYRQLITHTISQQPQLRYGRTSAQRWKRHSMFEIHDDNISNLSPPPSRTTTSSSYRFISNKQEPRPETATSVQTGVTVSDSEFDDEQPTISLAHPRTTRPPIIQSKLGHIEVNPFQNSNQSFTTPSSMPVTPRKQPSPLHNIFLSSKRQ